MTGKHERKVKNTTTRRKPKRSNLHLAMVMASMVLAIILDVIKVEGWLHVALAASPSVPSVIVELFDRVLFREDMIEQVIEKVIT